MMYHKIEGSIVLVVG